MIVPKILLEKTNKGTFESRIPKILERGWEYLKGYFSDENEYFVFLEQTSKDQFEDFLYTIFFYYTHDLYRIPDKERIVNIDGFMYQITLSIIEYLNKETESPRERIKDFIKYFSTHNIKALNEAITARSLTKIPVQLEFWEILYDMRNEFIHEAHWFNLIEQNSEAFASLSGLKHRNKDRTEIQYLGDIRIKFQEYLRFFWEAYLKYFGEK